MSEQFDVDIRILSQPRYLCVVRAAISAAIERYGFDDTACAQFMLAVDEAVTNVIRHGYGSADDRPIWVRLRPTDVDGNAGVTIVVDDQAKQVEPEIIRGRDLKDVRPGGLGVHIIREVMDDVAYTKRPEGGMRLTMSKTKTPAAAESESN